MDRPSFICSSPKYTTAFQETHDFGQRQQLANTVIRKYPDRVPVIVEAPGNKYRAGMHQKVTLGKSKYLVPNDVTVHKFLYELRKHIIGLESFESIFLYIVNPNRLHMPALSCVMSDIYNKYKQDDGFLYIYISEESVFG